MNIELNEQLVQKLLDTVDQGLCLGKGSGTPGNMCVEQAVSFIIDGNPMSDTPSCVHPVVNRFKIALNDKTWSSPQARAEGMREVAVAQLGSQHIYGQKFAQYVAEQTIRQILPIALRAIGLEAEAARCEQEGTKDSAISARVAAREVYKTRGAAANAAANAAAYAAYAAGAAADAACAAAYAANAAGAKRMDKILSISAQIAVEALKVCGAHGVAYLGLCKK